MNRKERDMQETKRAGSDTAGVVVAVEIILTVAGILGIIALMSQDWNHVQELEMIRELEQQKEEQMERQQDRDEGSGIVLLEKRGETEAGERIKKQAQPYRFIRGCPLSKGLQRDIFDICESAGMSFEFVMAVIHTESGFRPGCVSDDGESVGLMQIQGRWHRPLMDKLGCTDLKDPVQNVRVGIELLRRQCRKYKDPAWALMAYNGGGAYAGRMIDKGKVSRYAEKVLEKARKYEEMNGL